MGSCPSNLHRICIGLSRRGVSNPGSSKQSTAQFDSVGCSKQQNQMSKALSFFLLVRFHASCVSAECCGEAYGHSARAQKWLDQLCQVVPQLKARQEDKSSSTHCVFCCFCSEHGGELALLHFAEHNHHYTPQCFCYRGSSLCCTSWPGYFERCQGVSHAKQLGGDFQLVVVL